MSAIKAASKSRALFALFALTASTNIASATVWYVSVAGNDANSGTSTSAALKTIQAAANKVSPGDTVIVGDGTYTGSRWTLVDVARGGSSGNPVTFRAQNPGGAKLYGSNSATLYGWAFEPGVSYVNIQNFEIYNFPQTGVIIGKNQNINLSGLNIHNIGKLCSNSALGMTGIYANQSSSISISDNIISNIGRYSPGENGCSPTNENYKNHDHAIYLDGVTNVNVQSNTTYGVDHGWSVQIYSGSARLSTNVSISNNRFYYANPYVDGQVMIAYPGLRTGSVANNTFFQPRNQALVFWNNQTLSGISVTGNTTQGAVITLSAPAGVTLSSNINDDYQNPIIRR